MSDLATLISRLEEEVAFTEDGFRLLQRPNAESRIFSEIEQTILPRNLTFRNEDNQEIECYVEAGKIIAGDKAERLISNLKSFEEASTSISVRRLIHAQPLKADEPIKHNTNTPYQNEAKRLAQSLLVFRKQVEVFSKGDSDELSKLRNLVRNGLVGRSDKDRFAVYSSMGNEPSLIASTCEDQLMLMLIEAKFVDHLKSAWDTTVSS